MLSMKEMLIIYFLCLLSILLHGHTVFNIITEAAVQRCSVKKVFLEISQENTCDRVSFLIKLQETLAQVFSCEFCEISKNTFSYRKPPMAASEGFYLDLR